MEAFNEVTKWALPIVVLLFGIGCGIETRLTWKQKLSFPGKVLTATCTSLCIFIIMWIGYMVAWFYLNA